MAAEAANPATSRSCVRTPQPDFAKFKEHLEKKYRKTTFKPLFSYSKKYWHVLQSGDASELHGLPKKAQLHAMAALASLSKFYGVYDRWQAIRKNHDLKWSYDNDLQVFQNLTDNSKGYSAMLEWFKNACAALDSSHADILRYAVMTGLRPSEACQSIDLLKDSSNNDYLNDDSTLLQHFKFPQLFLRKTKKSYISVVTPEILEIGRRANDCGYNPLRLQLQRRKIPTTINLCRKINATYLKKHGIDTEMIDLLHGRVPKSVFARHYNRQNFLEEVQRIRACLKQLQTEIRG